MPGGERKKESASQEQHPSSALKSLLCGGWTSLAGGEASPSIPWSLPATARTTQSRYRGGLAQYRQQYGGRISAAAASRSDGSGDPPVPATSISPTEQQQQPLQWVMGNDKGGDSEPAGSGEWRWVGLVN